MTAQTYGELRALQAWMERAGQYPAARKLKDYLDMKGKPRPRGRPPCRKSLETDT